MRSLLLVIFSFLAFSAFQRSPLDTIAGASFGTKESRVQFYEGRAKMMKLSYNVGSYDDVSGPSLKLASVSTTPSNTVAIYSNYSFVAKVDQIEKNSVRVTFTNKSTKKEETVVFSPRKRDLGKRPR